MAEFKVRDILSSLDARMPAGAAEEWDNVGLLVGSSQWKTSGAVISIDLTREAIQAAKRKGYRLILNHHPCIFPKGRGLSKVVFSGKGDSGDLVSEALEQGIAVAAYHTNFDRCALEVAQKISDGLGFMPIGRLLERPSGSLLKLVVYVPRTHLESVRAAVSDAGAGKIGNYDQCAFASMGEGTYRGGQETTPFMGVPGKLERAEEARLETILPKGMENRVLRAMFQAHPYEEVAYDLIPVIQGPASKGLAVGLGYGVWGTFQSPKLFSEVLKDVTSLFKIQRFLMTPSGLSLPKKMSTLAFAAGKGASFVESAASLGCELLITGEVGYHTALAAARKGMAVMEIGHRESERFFSQVMKDWLSRMGIRSVVLDLPTQQWMDGGLK